MKKAKIVTLISGILCTIGINRGYKFMTKQLSLKEKEKEKFQSYYNLLNRWIFVQSRGNSLEEFLLENNYHSIAIYGMGELGKRLVEQLKDSKVEVKYAIDQEAGGEYLGINVLEKTDVLPAVDVMVVTAIFAFDTIQKDMKNYYEGEIISLEEVIFSI